MCFILGNTTNFQFHIDKEHVGIASGVKTPKAPVPITSFTGQLALGKISSERQKQIDDALNKLIVRKVLPVSLVDNKYFLQFVHLLDRIKCLHVQQS